MSLRVKFNIVMLAAFAAGLILALLFVNTLSRQEARRSVLAEAAVMMGQVDSTIHYTDSDVAPLLAHQMMVQFLPQAIPFFTAQKTFNLLATEFPDYTLRQPTLNPTNPADRPMPWEKELVDRFINDPHLASLVVERQADTGPILSYARPVRVTDQECLACHSTPEAAPATMLDVYGRTNGFGWKMGDVIGAQVVSVPESVADAQARHNLLVIMGALAIVFAVMLLLLNIMLHLFIIVPVSRISRLADEISLGNMTVPEFNEAHHDEIGSLAQAFNRMRRSLVAALKLLEQPVPSS
jgi:HAMP domain-containing protein